MIRRTKKIGPLWVLLLITLGVFQVLPTNPAPAASGASSQLSRADAEFRLLKSRQSLQKYRHNYDKVERLYGKVIEGHRGSDEAAEALLRCGELKTLLYRWTSLRSELDRSRDYYHRLLQEYPRSPFADDARAEVALLYLNYYNDPVQAYREFDRVVRDHPRGNRSGEARNWLKRLSRYRASAESGSRPSVSSKSSTPSASLLARAEKSFAELKGKTRLQRYRHNYLKVLDLYRRVFDEQAGTAEAEMALLRAGELYTLLYRWTSSKSDLNSAKHYYQRLTRDYPGSALADDAFVAVARLYLDQYEDPARAYDEFQNAATAPDGDRRGEAEGQLKKLHRHRPAAADESARPRLSSPVPTVLARIGGIRHWSNPEYTRVVIDLDRSANFYSNLLKESSELHKPPRLYVDLFNALVGKDLRTTIPVNDGILHSIRAGQFTPDTVRVVLDIDQLESYTIFPMENPFRIVIDARGGGKPSPRRVASGKRESSTVGKGTYSLARQLGLGIRKVVIDAGHGAHDPGAVGVKGLKEKDVTLDIALRLRDLLRLEGLEVIMTRDRDAFLGLEERTAIANRSHGDLFISLHANSSRRPGLRGVETYFLNLASSERAMETAALENSMSMAKMSDLEEILQEIFNSKMDESSHLAGTVQKGLVENLGSHYRDIKDLGVKQAPFYVLIGAQMPSILAEVSFINHPVEGARLATARYRQHLAESLSAGITDYVRSVNMASARP